MIRRVAIVVAAFVVATSTMAAASPSMPVHSDAALPAQVAAGVGNATPNDSFTSIDCRAPGSCTAVGQFLDANGNHEAMTASMRNGVWGPPLPAVFAPSVASSSPNDAFTSVSCSAPGFCTAVGWFANTAGYQQAMMATQSGGTWGTVTALTPASATPNDALVAVSCTGAGDCTAAGSEVRASGAPVAVTVQQVNGRWLAPIPVTLPSAVASASTTSGFTALSCVVTSCVAAGWFVDTNGYHEAMTDTVGLPAQPVTFSTGPSPNPNDGLDAVSCAAVGSCTAVGWFLDAVGSQEAMAAQSRHGTFGAVHPATYALPGTIVAPGGEFTAVSCPTPGNCVAVGTLVTATGAAAMTESLTNGVWHPVVVAASLPGASATNDAFTAVSCSTIVDCTAVGHGEDATGNLDALSQTLRNGVWLSVVTATYATGVASPTPYDSFLAVSCVTSANCVAAGYFLDANGNTQAMTQRSSSPLVITGVPFANVTVGHPFIFHVGVAEVASCQWTLAPSGAPRGVHLSATGMLTGTATSTWSAVLHVTAHCGDQVATASVPLRAVSPRATTH